MRKKRCLVIVTVLLMSLLFHIPKAAEAVMKPQIESSSNSQFVSDAESDIPQQSKTGSTPPSNVIEKDNKKPTELTETTRTGAWLDGLTFTVVNEWDAINAIKDGTIDIYNGGLTDGYSDALADPDLAVETSNGLSHELTLNPAEFYDTNQLNPFTVPAIREALNYLIDRNYVAHVTYGDLATPKFFPIMVNYPDYKRYAVKTATLESLYAYDPVQAELMITDEMNNLGATLSGDKWYYNGEPVTLIFLIRNDSDGARIPIGNYIADQLESIGFTVDRQYKTSAEASPLWILGDPAEGLWHLYTGAWGWWGISRDEGDNFRLFYTPESVYGGVSPLWQAYNPTPEFLDLCNLLANHNFASMAERDIAYERALELALEDSVRVWLVDGKGFDVRSVNTTAAYDLSRGLYTLYPYTARFLDAEGGDLTIGNRDLFVDPWNPFAHINWSLIPKLATQDHALLTHPTNGLPMAQRIESAVVTAQTGLPIQDSSDWVTLNFASSIDVPTDAWSDWDAQNQQFISIGTGETATIKSVVTYPSDLFSTVKWHDGSPLSIGDFVMNMIIGVDRTKEDSPIYDESAWSKFQGIKAIRITSEDPLVIETYFDDWSLDAEQNVYPWWPEGDSGPTPWHTTALSADVEADGLAAFSSEKSDALTIPWMNYLTEPTKTYMNDSLSTMTNDIPYANTLSAYISSDEATIRWTNLRNWYAAQGHFWVGNGPFFIDAFDWDAKTLHMTRFDDFPDEVGKWDEFSADPNPILEINHTEGEPGSFFTLTGSFYPPDSTASLYLNSTFIDDITVDSSGEFQYVLDTSAAETGDYRVMIKVNPAAVTSFVLVEDGDLHENENPEAPEIEVPEEIAENPPEAFTKTSPSHEAEDVSTSPTLAWAASSGTTNYEYCYDTSDDNSCSGWINVGSGLFITLSNLDPETTYYWQVRAWDGDAGPTNADGSETAFWSFTTEEEISSYEVYLPLILFYLDLDINIDGNGDDWQGAFPTLTDAQGDSTGPDHTDEKAAYSYMDDEFLYIMVELYDPPLLTPGATIELNLNVTASDYSVWWLHTNINADGSFSAWTDFDENGEIEAYPIEGEVMAWGDVMELRIPVSEIGYPRYARIILSNFWCDPGSGWTWVDSMQ